MDSSKIMDLLDQLDDDIDDLEESLDPLLKTPLLETASKFPLLDKAKLYVLATYAIESLLFSYLRLHGMNAREHPVFIELTRVKQYFEKIKLTESPSQKKNALDKQAAARFIKAGLAGNDKFDLAKAEQLAKQRARAHIKLEQLSAKKRQVETAAQAHAVDDKAAEVESSVSDSSSDSSSEVEDFADEAEEISPNPDPPGESNSPTDSLQGRNKRQKLDSSSNRSESVPGSENTALVDQKAKKNTKSMRKAAQKKRSRESQNARQTHLGGIEKKGKQVKGRNRKSKKEKGS